MQRESLALKSLKRTALKSDDDVVEGGFKRRMRAFYNTHVKVEAENQEEKLKATLKGLAEYLFFIVLLLIISFNNVSDYMYYYNKVMARLFVDTKGNVSMSFREINEVRLFWKFAKGPLLDGLYWRKWYNTEDLKNSNISGYLFYQNKLLGLPKLRQMRVNSEDCFVTKEMKQFVQTCYPEFTSTVEDHSAFGLGATDPNASAWNYHTEEENKEFWFWGQISHYGGGGFVQQLPMDREETLRILEELETREWIRRGTRVVFVSFTTYNANMDLFCIIRLCVEFPSTGGAIPSWSVISVKLNKHKKYKDSLEIFTFVVRIIFVVYICYFILEEVIQMYFESFSYFKEFWNAFDMLLIICCLVDIGLMAGRELTIRDISADDVQSGEVNFNAIAFLEEMVLNSIAVTIFVALIKVFKYISFNKTMAVLSSTLSSCAKDLLGFFIMFFIVFLAFTQLGYLFFGSQTPEFNTFMNSFFTLFRIILGDFNFHQLEQANRILGPIFFLLFVFFVFFVLINMFLAIINDTYSEVKSDMSKQAEEIVMSDYLKQNIINLISRLKGRTSRSEAERSGSQMVNFYKQIQVEDWKHELQEKGFTLRDIDNVLLKYGVSNEGYIDSAGQHLLLNELERQKESHLRFMAKTQDDDEISFDSEGSDDEYLVKEYLKYRDFVNVFRRVERMESRMKGLYHKTDALITLFGQKKPKT